MKTDDVNRLIDQRQALAHKALDEMVAENQRLGLYDDAVNMTQECVDETAKGEHDTLGSEWVECVKLPIVVHVRNQREGETHISTREGITPVLPDDLIMRGVAGEEYPIGRGLFERTYTFDTAPPKKEWVGLTDEELYYFVRNAESYLECAKGIEAKLKEKNT